MMPYFWIGTGLEYLGVVGSDRSNWRMPDRLGRVRIIALLVFWIRLRLLPVKTTNKGSARAGPVAAPMPKLDSFYWEEKVNTLGGNQICISLFCLLSLLCLAMYL